MKPLPWAKSALALCIMGTLTACGGGGTDENNQGDVVTTPPPVSSSSSGGSSSSSSSGGSGGGAEGPILSENFGDDLFVNFDEADTQFFFSQEYKALATNNAEDAWPSFFYPTCCFFLNDNPADGIEVSLDQLGIVSDAGNPAMLLNTGRFSAGQTRLSIDDSDPKKDTTTSDDVTTWGELDLSSPYRISFCVKDASGTRNMQVYVDNNTSGEANSVWGGGGSGSRIFNVPAADLIPGKRVQINVPGDIAYELGGEVKDVRPAQVGSATSFLQFRVEGGSSIIFDDLLVERQEDDGQADLPACTVFQPATAPEAPEAPSLFASDAQMSVSWASSVGATAYDVAYNTSDDVNTAMLVEGLTETTTTLTELTNGSTYHVWVRAVNNVGAGDWSEATTAMPEAPVGDSCTPTTSVDPSATNSIMWNVYDGCGHPGELGSVVINGSEATSFSFSDEELPWFEVSDLGVMTMDTREGDDNTKPVGDLDGVIAGDATTYPKHFTFIARIDTSLATALDSVRGFEIETHLGDGGVADRGPARIKTILRPDGNKIQLDKFLSDDSTAEVDMDMTDGYHIYQVSFVVNDPATAGDEYITTKVYRDGVEVGSFTGNGRDGGNSGSRMRIGEGSGSPFYADVDWLVWTDSAAAASLTPAELVGELPAGIGELDVYAGGDSSAVLEENFNGVGLVEDSESEDTNFFSAEYRGLSSDGSLPMFNVTSGSSRISVSGGTLSLHDARFSIGDALHHTDVDTADTDTTGRGDLDLSKPYIISFEVVENPNTSVETGKCQVYIDNNTSSSSKSMHADGGSKLVEKYASQLADGDKPTGTVTFASDPEVHVGTANSFLQVRCDSGTRDLPVVIDNFKVSYQ
ncbi:fibronectin type III domain-containing protein [Microbulbifer sp. CAU 1566]|uniref:fibronectin type III domain-containing protein n=1 Tax=Microbulbifer sp. CAU 1566 TaxID=2933269 RepID=UPI0020055DC1|nr:fibronectin type III domain-containing protein [Microbulbifer sp. CAU 1566]MCK7598976.1 fibronectin type III domain-containing protein [Microbulbifer sp. CAU 1566]